MKVKTTSSESNTTMKNNRLTLLTTAALAAGAFLLNAPNAIAADPGTGSDATNTKAGSEAADSKIELDPADAKFIQEEAAAGAALVRIAELGVKKAERADIKAFARVIIAEHTVANAELAALAASNGLELTSEVDKKHADTYEKLDAKSDAEFDKEFLSVMVKNHKHCVKQFEDAAEDAKDNEVKLWAAKMLPGLQAHLEKAEELNPDTKVKDGEVSSEIAPAQPDNTARNMRDRDANTLTPLDQGNNKADTATTAQIRREIMALDDISINAQNVKIITNDGRVTLRGPVNSAEERRLIGDIATRIVTSEHTDNQLEVRGDETNN
jgi:putative membrane protein